MLDQTQDVWCQQAHESDGSFAQSKPLFMLHHNIFLDLRLRVWVN